uniref:Peptidase S1 domain-containing protein n=1 Tax=Timema cristinae TaxID=61476 RepID=A0A7R9CFL2_TIMCR|nr:unnamed protein product [Timema cristinae]
MAYLIYQACGLGGEASKLKTNNLTHESILGGSRSYLGEYPFMLALEDQTHQFCGASAIGKSWAITAAHCLTGFKDRFGLN